MEIRFEAGFKRPRDATESAKLVSEAAVDVRCHVRILPTWIQYKNDKDETQFNTFLDHLSVSITTKIYTSVMIRVCHSRSRFLSCMYIHDKFMTESR